MEKPQADGTSCGTGLSEASTGLLSAAGNRGLRLVRLEFVINDRFQSKLQEMREYAATQTAELQCPVMR